MVAIGCLIEAKGISVRQKETAQTDVCMPFVPETRPCLQGGRVALLPGYPSKGVKR